MMASEVKATASLAAMERQMVPVGLEPMEVLQVAAAAMRVEMEAMEARVATEAVAVVVVRWAARLAAVVLVVGWEARMAEGTMAVN